MHATMTTTEGALRLWREIARGLQAAGYAKVVPEYLKLSRALSQTRMTELLQGAPEAQHWTELRKLALEALQSLDPLVEAARVLAQLPCELRETVSVPSHVASEPLQAELQLPVSQGEPEVPVLLPADPPSSHANAVPRRRPSKTEAHVIQSPKPVSSKRKKSAVSKSKLSAATRGRVKSH
ncbi:MAG TPA: hypothetical protein VKY85_12875 [Candidatus Angelobacter sp.]|nr:hypothetical protein [Candidatus Angelobacter sp.]